MHYFRNIREQIVGINHYVSTPYGYKKLIYFDWTASGRLFYPIEEKMLHVVGPMIANTHTESNSTGSFMTNLYLESLQKIKKHVNANSEDVIITEGSGCTTVINKFQRILGLKVPERFQHLVKLEGKKKPVIFLSHMEHHSNQTSWMETIADVVIVEPTLRENVKPEYLRELLSKYNDRDLKIGSFTACSNVTGVVPPYHELAKIMHEHGGYCFVDFVASAPYVHMNMHPEDPMEKLDAIFFSPHKFLGGPGSCGVLIFDSKLYSNTIPDHPGGGTVVWTNPWGGKKYFDSIEAREDGGTPNFLQTVRAALAVSLKDEMLLNGMYERKNDLLDYLWSELTKIEEVVIFERNDKDRLCIISFYIENTHYNLVVKLLDERFGIQVRGGCSCAGTYGHYLLKITPSNSKKITDQLDSGNMAEKPGWVRVSLHPTNTTDEIDVFIFAINEIIENYQEWKKDYIFDPSTNEFTHKAYVEPSFMNFFA
ncbi:aminotransferase class V-fold PLP-dependent enzyme [Bacillus carboniphilus]|uniref:Aminotransferase class V-fold PLP-dependent enzyme n=1 Tax=Bacillus carboniphilus TaxID=86663 RepID=A0ABY9JUA3_9BACI|nr:aminotransferase class V-fold PLP-dependent enzyme [Bacillus carboniphilus]WLR42984.1 aminotransferase class V-fold PLP-dependent enzyme [Bacillus carboniphilus]